MDRRNFLKAIALTGALLSIKKSGAITLISQKFSGETIKESYDLVAVMGGDPVSMFRKAIAEMGGMGKFIKKGQKVVVKPNIGWDKTPELAANTNPELVSEIVRQCYKAGAKEVIVFDHTCDNWQKAYTNSGIEEAVKKTGGKMLPAHESSYYSEVSIPNGVMLKKTMVHQAILDSDVWINVPVLKNHGGAKMSIAMKNYMGIVWDRKFFHKNDLQQCIADVCSIEKKAVLHVVDAFRLMKENGPRGKSEADVVLSKGLFISQDIVAADTAATSFFNQVREMPLESVSHIGKGEKQNLGTTNLGSLNIKRIKL